MGWFNRVGRRPGSGGAAQTGNVVGVSDGAEVSAAVGRHGSENRIVANARREFSGAFADLARGKRNWQLMAFGLAALAGTLTVAYVQLANSVRIVPYIVQVDKLGQIAAAGVAEPIHTPDQRLIVGQLAQFIRAIRTVLPAAAAAAQAKILQRGYAFAGPEAAAFLNDYFAAPQHDPRVLGGHLTREVEIASVLRVPRSDTWKIQWTEHEIPLQGGEPPRTVAWESYVTIKFAPPASTDVVQDNPLGLYVTSISWAQVAATAAPHVSTAPAQTINRGISSSIGGTP